MKRSEKQLGTILAILLALVCALSGCGSPAAVASDSASPNATAQETPAASSETQAESASATPEAREEVSLITVLLGEAPPDGSAVMEEVNRKMLTDIQATLDLQYIAFGDIATKYPLMLASSQDWDIIYGNVSYGNNAAKGAYREITLADVEKNAPLTFAATTDAQWADAQVSGKIYMIPQSFKELDVGAHFFREDLRKKYGVPEIKTGTDFITSLETLSKNGVVPFDGNPDDIKGVFSVIFNPLCDYNRPKGTEDLLCYSTDDNSGKTMGLLDAEYADKFKQAATEVKRLMDAGVLPKNVYAQKSTSRDLFKVEKTAVWTNAFENYPQYATDCAANGWELGAFPGLSNQGSSLLRPSTGNGFSFSPMTKNYERALMAVDLIHQEPSYNMLVAFGIEGKNYVMKDGKLALGPDIDPAQNPYPMYGAGFWSNNRDQWPPLEAYTQDYIDMKKMLQDNGKSNLLNGFNGMDDSIKTELANIANVQTQYGLPIKLGLVKDPVAAVDTYIEKLKAAGAEKVVAEYKKQIADFIAAHAQ